MKSEKKSEVKVFNLFSYIVLIAVALLIVTREILPKIGLKVDGPLIDVLETIKDVLILIMVAIMSYNFIKGKGKAVVIIYWIAIVVFVAGMVLRWVL